MTVPRYFYGFWPELERVEIGERAAYAYDESNSLMHRFCRAYGVEYDIGHNFWSGKFNDWRTVAADRCDP